MHQQIRTDPRLSPPDVHKLLTVLQVAGVNVVAVAGGGLEHGGQIALSCHVDGKPDQTGVAESALRDAGYDPHVVSRGHNPEGFLFSGAMSDKEGQLAAQIRAARDAAGTGFVVEDVAVGVPNGDTYPVQVFLARR